MPHRSAAAGSASLPRGRLLHPAQGEREGRARGPQVPISTQAPAARPLSHGPTPQERLARLLQDAEARGVKPVDEAALEAMGGVWPKGENLDEFLAWLYESRRNGRYD